MGGSGGGRNVGLVCVAVAFIGAGWSAASAATPPAPEELRPSTVARISDVPPRFEAVTIGELRHALVLAAAQEGLRSVPEPGQGGYGMLETGAVNALLETAWINGLAAEWGMGVTRDEVKRELSRVKKGIVQERCGIPPVPEGKPLHVP
ncbi:MAG: hypothetical protein ABW196_05025 [Solirubrobacterales bacterium]